jgi:hypothetical protein
MICLTFDASSASCFRRNWLDQPTYQPLHTHPTYCLHNSPSSGTDKMALAAVSDSGGHAIGIDGDHTERVMSRLNDLFPDGMSSL